MLRAAEVCGGIAGYLAWSAWPLTLALPLPMVCAGAAAGGATSAFWSVMWSTGVQTHIPAAVLNHISATVLIAVLIAMLCVPAVRDLAARAAENQEGSGS